MAEEEAEEGVWEVDSWEDKWQHAAPASEAGMGLSPGAPYWDSFATFGQRLLHSSASQGQALTSAIFGAAGGLAAAAAAASSPKAGILLPLLAANHAEEEASLKRNDERVDVEAASGSGRWRELARPEASSLNPGSLEAGRSISGPSSGAVPLMTVRTHEERSPSSRSCLPLPRLSQSRRANSADLGASPELAVGALGQEEVAHPVLTGRGRKGGTASSPAGGYTRAGGGGEHSWKGKVMEVLPVLAVVALAVLCTVAYLFIVDGVFGEERAAFSLSCDVGEGRWVRSSRRPLYLASCPYMRDAWNCQKFGLGQNEVEAAWRWQPRHCSLPQFDAADFLRKMESRSVGFVGDESAANAFDSMICMLAVAEAPEVVSGAKEEIEPLQGAAAVQVARPGAQAGLEAGSGWHAIEAWKLPWRTRGGAAGRGSPAALRGVVHEDFEEGSRLVYRFAAHNVTFALFHSPLLVKSVTSVEVNDTACQLRKAALAAAAAAGDGEVTPSAGNGAADVCYPNKVDLDEPDPLWAAEARAFDVLVLNSGSAWREEERESRGLGLFLSGARQENFSMEGLVKQWAYPKAMLTVATWLGNRSNFDGNVVFRSYSPSHHRRECAGRTVLKDEEAAQLTQLDNITRYDIAVRAAMKGTHAYFMNVSLLSAVRGDGHPWMASPHRPQADCTSWCLPGVPDSWNEILAAAVA